jgi:hypothetical protein
MPKFWPKKELITDDGIFDADIITTTNCWLVLLILMPKIYYTEAEGGFRI